MVANEVLHPAFLSGGGELGELIRAKDWSQTAIGPPDQWPQSLRTILSMMLSTRQPMFLWWGPDRIQFYNDAYRPGLDSTGRHPTALGQRGETCWPDDWSRIEALIERVLAGESTGGDEQRVVPDGSSPSQDVSRTVDYSSVQDETGRAAGVLGIGRETSRAAAKEVLMPRQLATSDQQFRQLFQQAPMAVAILRGPVFVVELANPRICTIWNRTEEQLLGQPLFETLPEVAGQGFEQRLTDVLQTGMPFVGTELAVPFLRDGQTKTVYVNFVCEPLRDGGTSTADGLITGIVVIGVDVTEQVLARQPVEQLLIQERELNELKSNFVTLASHEFRTPMGTILSSASLIGRYSGADDGEKRERHVQRIKSAVHSLTGLLNDFLSLSQMEQANMHGRPFPLNIVTFCHEVIEDIQAIIKPGQRVVYTHRLGEPDLSLDGQMLKNVLINLLVNASKYSADDKQIELTTAVDGGNLVVTVRDEGIGIPDADKDKLFINFFRARNANQVEGTGLGLYIVKRYVDLLGGIVTFTSQLDSGTIFTVQLPLSPLPIP